MANAKNEPRGEELFYGYIADYLDGDLPSNLVKQFESELSSRQQELSAFQANRGRLQSALGDIGGSEALKHKLRNLAQDDQVRETMEASEIAEVEKAELWSNVLRRSTLVAMVLGIVGVLVYFFMPERLGRIDIVTYIGYEALAIEEDPEGRTNLPSADAEEIRQFVAAVPGLEFRPAMLRPLKGWNPEGVSIIDYDFMKVIAVNYTSPERANEKLHHFMFGGVMSSMKYKGEEADYRGIKYRVYGSDKLNLIVWQQTPDMMSVLAGRRSAPELAEMARAGTPE